VAKSDIVYRVAEAEGAENMIADTTNAKQLAEDNMGLLKKWCKFKLHHLKKRPNRKHKLRSLDELLADMSEAYMLGIHSYLKKSPGNEVSLGTWIWNMLNWEWFRQCHRERIVPFSAKEFISQKELDDSEKQSHVWSISDVDMKILKNLSYQPNIIEEMEKRDQKAQFEAALVMVRGGRRRLLDKYLQGASYAELGRELGVSRQAIEQRIKIIIERISEHLTKEKHEKEKITVQAQRPVRVAPPVRQGQSVNTTVAGIAGWWEVQI